MPRNAPLIILLGLICFYQGMSVGQANAFQQVTICRAEFPSIHLGASDELEKLYKKLGYKVAFKDLPNRRSLLEAARGVCFGEVARIESATLRYPSLLRTAHPIHTIRAYAYSLDEEVQVSSWGDLNNYSVGIIRGELYAEERVQGKNFFLANSYDELFRLLERKRLDVVVGLEGVVGSSNMTSNIHKSDKALWEFPLYHLVHRKNAHILPKLNNLIKQD
ncbi:exported hypothetical protein [Candidatus Terasakiella magnetica]|uniref:Solute-binding protein family 3/N-terminal domain-containing protein n=1 Tax=Candidatus Terasakiella magnetica TaxID=1867952 RepID=A0A1C3RJX5_9PROT|nr:hypothetical protein [Candidatus Terasakiella magnetica]SCA57592.1 exported hypothetical protein [Candidatus Terasakiella magnetica]